MKRTFASLGAFAATTALLVLSPATAAAAPSYASLYVNQNAYPGYPEIDDTEISVSVGQARRDETSRALSVRYEDGAFFFVDSAGIVPRPLTGQIAEGSTCVSAGPFAVRCPVDLGDPEIVGIEFNIATGDGDDRLDLRAMPDLPGLQLTQSTEGNSDGPARPYFETGGGSDLVLTGAFDADGNLGEGADRLRGGPGADGAPYPEATSLGGGPVEGGPGRDRLVGGAGNDWLVGGDGGDFLKGDAGSDILVGEWGGDRIHSRDGEIDVYSCGPGLKRKQAIRRDRVDAPIAKDRPRFRGNCLTKEN